MHEICFHNGLLQRKDSSCANPSVRTTGCQRASLAGRFRSARRLAKPVSAAANGGVLLFFGFGSDGVMFLCCTSQPKEPQLASFWGNENIFATRALLLRIDFCANKYRRKQIFAARHSSRKPQRTSEGGCV